MSEKIGKWKMGNFFDWVETLIERGWDRLEAFLRWTVEWLLFGGVTVLIGGPALTLIVRAAIYLKTGGWAHSACGAAEITPQDCSIATSFVGLNDVVYYTLNTADMSLVAAIAGVLILVLGGLLFGAVESFAGIMRI